MYFINERNRNRNQRTTKRATLLVINKARKQVDRYNESDIRLRIRRTNIWGLETFVKWFRVLLLVD